MCPEILKWHKIIQIIFLNQWRDLIRLYVLFLVNHEIHLVYLNMSRLVLYHSMTKCSKNWFPEKSYHQDREWSVARSQKETLDCDCDYLEDAEITQNLEVSVLVFFGIEFIHKLLQVFLLHRVCINDIKPQCFMERFVKQVSDTPVWDIGTTITKYEL